MTAAEIIEQANVRGMAYGGASVCETAPDYIEVRPDASSDDVFALIEQVRDRVSEKLGVELTPEINVW